MGVNLICYFIKQSILSRQKDMLNLIHLNAFCMKEYTQLTHQCMDKEKITGFDFKACEGEATLFLQECQAKKMQALDKDTMAAHYFHVTPKSQWDHMGLAHHKWMLSKPYGQFVSDEDQKYWKEAEPSPKFKQQYLTEYNEAVGKYDIDKYQMHLSPYMAVTAPGSTNSNVINIENQPTGFIQNAHQELNVESMEDTIEMEAQSEDTIEE